MLYNTDRSALAVILKSSTCKVNNQTMLGILHYDCANWVTYQADGEHVCDIHGVRCQRKASLANGKYQYYDIHGNLVASN